MFRKSPYLDSLPVLSLQAEQLSRYKLRRSKRDDHFCTAEVAALCLHDLFWIIWVFPRTHNLPPDVQHLESISIAMGVEGQDG